MGTTHSKGIDGVPDGLTVFHDLDACALGCYIQVSASDAIVVSGTVNQIDFVQKLYKEQCTDPTTCHDNVGTAENTESYYNKTSTESFWYDAVFSGTADGLTATAMYMTILKHTALESVRQFGVSKVVFACNDRWPTTPDPDNSAGCDPHEKTYWHLPGQITTSLWDVNTKDKKGHLVLTFDVKSRSDGFCDVLKQLGEMASIPPLADAPSTGLDLANFMVGIACS